MFGDKYGGHYKKSGVIHQFHYSDYAIEYTEGNRSFSDSRVSIQKFVLPTDPIIANNTIYFPVRILAERLELLTKFENEKIYVAVPPEGFSKISMPLLKTLSTSNCSKSTSLLSS